MINSFRPLNRLLLFLLLLFPVLQSEAQGRFFGARETVYPTWFKESFLDLNEDVADAVADGRRLMLFFHQNGCPYCNLSARSEHIREQGKDVDIWK